MSKIKFIFITLLVLFLLVACPMQPLLQIDVSNSKDFDTLITAGNHNPDGLWSDGETMWVSDYQDVKIYAYSLATKQRVTNEDFNNLVSSGNSSPTGIWSDGSTMWVSDVADDKLYAYDLVTKQRKSHEDFNTLKSADNGTPRGLWSDGETMWVSDAADKKIYAYDLFTKVRNGDKDIDEFTLTNASNQIPIGLWSDGITMWVSDALNGKVYAYDLTNKNKITKDINGTRGNQAGRGIWSDGKILYIADSRDSKIYGYDIDSSFVSVSNLNFLLFRPNLIVRDVNLDSTVLSNGQAVTFSVVVSNLGNRDATSTVLRWYGSTDFSTQLGEKTVDSLSIGEYEKVTSSFVADTNHFGRYYYQVCIDAVSIEANTINNCSQVRVTISPQGTPTGAFPVGTQASGIWSDSNTMWVSFSGEEVISAYDLRTKSWIASNTFAFESRGIYRASGNIWSDGTTMWIADLHIDTSTYDYWIVAYDLATKTRDASKDIRVVEPPQPSGLWSDGTTMWVSSSFASHADKIVAYDLRTKTRKSSQDIYLQPGIHRFAYGIWSDGTTMFLCTRSSYGDTTASTTRTIYAYDMASKSYVSNRNIIITLPQSRDNWSLFVSDIWSDGTTMWISLYDRAFWSSVRAYDLTTKQELP